MSKCCKHREKVGCYIKKNSRKKLSFNLSGQKDSLYEKDKGENEILRERLSAEGKKWVGKAGSGFHLPDMH